MAVTLYSSEDAGAPQWRTSGLTAGTNNITEILDAVLITGYGSKPGCGWVKVMSSEISDRTVYRNKSAHQNDMNLIVQSHPGSSRLSKRQAADTVVSPEEYYGYSGVALLGHNYGISGWIAIGDERTLVFANVYSGMNSSHYYVYGPCFIYAGDFETQGNNYPSAWGVLSRYMHNGVMDSVTSTSIACSVLKNINGNKELYPRPITSIPEQEWSENSVYYHCTNMMLGRELSYYWPTRTAGIMHIDQFVQEASVRSPWILIVEEKWMFRLRGTYSLIPELFYWNKNAGYPNSLKPFTINGTDYIASGAWSSVYFQTSGEW